MAANQLSEQEIQFRKRARRRLVGAVALVLLMVTVLPMVLDDRQAKAPQPDIAISIPSQEGSGFTSKIVPVTPPTAVPQAPAPATNLQLAPPLEKPQAAPAKPSVPPSKPEAEAPSRPVEAAPAPKPATPAETAKPAEAKPAAAKPQAVAAKPAAKNGGFVVQIGVFSEGPNVKQLEDKLVAQGFHPYSEKVDTPKGVKTRLRIGPFPTRPAAEAALEKLKSAAISGMVVANR